ncbi:MAG: hypothetical protein JRH01_26320 [Deltaproteobacteria bacterium]|nr:hypothetical protein [Deltaproteobacteria bacterium]
MRERDVGAQRSRSLATLVSIPTLGLCITVKTVSDRRHSEPGPLGNVHQPSDGTMLQREECWTFDGLRSHFQKLLCSQLELFGLAMGPYP